MKIKFPVKLIILTLLLLGTSKIYSQQLDCDAILLKVDEQKDLTFKMISDYKLFTDSSMSEVLEAEKVINYRDNNNYYFKMKNTEYILIGHFQLKINYDEKIILFSKSTLAAKLDSPLEQLNSLKTYFDTNQVVEADSYSICRYEAGKESSLPLKKMEFYVSKRDNRVKKQLFFFNESLKARFKNEKSASHEVLSVTEVSYTSKPKIPKKLFELSHYVVIEGSSFKLSDDFKNFTLLTN